VDVVLGVSVGPSTARIALIEGTEADGSVIDEAVLDLPSPRGADGGSAEVVDTIVGTRRSLEQNGHRLVAAGVCALDAYAAPALRAALARSGVDGVVLVSQDETTAALTRAHSAIDPGQPEVTAALGAALAAPSALARAGAPNPPTIVLSAQARPASPDATQMAPASPDATQMAPASDATQMAPAPDVTQVRSYEPQLAYSLTGSQEALTDYQPGPGTEDQTALVSPVPYESEPAKPERRSFMLVGSIVTAVVVIGLGAIAFSVAVGINPTSDNSPIAPSTPNFGPPPPPAGTGNSDQVPIAVNPSVPAAPPAPAPQVAPAPAPAIPASSGGGGSSANRNTGGGGGGGGGFSNPAPVSVPDVPPPAIAPVPEVAPPPPPANLPPAFLPPIRPFIPPIFLPPEQRNPVDKQIPEQQQAPAAGGAAAGQAPAAGGAAAGQAPAAGGAAAGQAPAAGGGGQGAGGADGQGGQESPQDTLCHPKKPPC
jgi:hypothetical protein